MLQVQARQPDWAVDTTFLHYKTEQRVLQVLNPLTTSGPVRVPMSPSAGGRRGQGPTRFDI